jgi:uncharacterized Zn finger protein
MKRAILLVGMAFAMMAAMAQDSPYIVKTKGVKKPDPKTTTSQHKESSIQKEPEATDFMGKNFRFYSMCDWKEGMRFMVVPEKRDLLINTFHDAATNKEVSSARLRHKIMVYKGHQDMSNGRVHVNFTCEDDNKNYYYELPNGSFDDYCFGKLGVPTLAYLGDVDKARELLMGQVLLTRTQFFRVDTEYDGDGYKDITVDKNKPVMVKAIGVGTRSFPVKIIVEDENGEQYYQNVAMSKTNSGMRDDEFIVDNEKYLFEGSFEFTGANMAVASDVKEYLGKTVHTKYPTSMSSKGSGKTRDVKVPRFTGFIIDEITAIKGSTYYTLTLRESESRRVYYKDVTFREEDVVGDANGAKEDYFGYLFAMGEGISHSTSIETRAAIREGRVIRGMSEDEVQLAMGEPYSKIVNSDGIHQWMYARSNGVVLDVFFDDKGKVKQAKARKAIVGAGNAAAAPAAGEGGAATTAPKRSSYKAASMQGRKMGTPLK